MNRNNDNPLSILLGLMAMSALIAAAIVMGKPAIRPAPQPPTTAGRLGGTAAPAAAGTEPAPGARGRAQDRANRARDQAGRAQGQAAG